MEEKQRYLRWLGILCVIMAAFCLAGLIVASAGFFWLAHRKRK